MCMCNLNERVDLALSSVFAKFLFQIECEYEVVVGVDGGVCVVLLVEQLLYGGLQVVVCEGGCCVCGVC